MSPAAQRVLMLAIAEPVVIPAAFLEKTEKARPDVRLVAITHGDPTDPASCGRPITYRATRVTEKRSADLVAVCSLHGDLVEVGPTGDYVGTFAYLAGDARPRRKLE
jgi:hypothetical protein